MEMCCFFRFGLFSHISVNPIGCCYEQDYAERNPRGKCHLQKHHLSVTAFHRTENQYHEIMEEFLDEIEFEK